MYRVPQRGCFYVLEVAFGGGNHTNMEVELEGSIPHDIELEFGL